MDIDITGRIIITVVALMISFLLKKTSGSRKIHILLQMAIIANIALLIYFFHFDPRWSKLDIILIAVNFSGLYYNVVRLNN